MHLPGERARVRSRMHQFAERLLVKSPPSFAQRSRENQPKLRAHAYCPMGCQLFGVCGEMCVNTLSTFVLVQLLARVRRLDRTFTSI